jgi:hypothetical protein
MSRTAAPKSFFTPLRFSQGAEGEAKESAIITLKPSYTSHNRLCLTYKEPNQLPKLLDRVVESGLRTVAIMLPETTAQADLAVKTVEGHLAFSGRQFLYIAFYGKEAVIKKSREDAQASADETSRLLLDHPPAHWQEAPKGWSFQSLTEQYSKTAFKLPAGLELSINLKESQKLLSSAFREYLNLMRTSNIKEFRKLYRASIQSRAVASYSCTAASGENVRLLLYDKAIAQAGAGKSVFTDGAYFIVTSFMSESAAPTVILAGASASYY